MSTGFHFPEPDALLDALVQLAAHNSELKQQSGHLFARLKSINRSATSHVKASKQQSAQARMAMDQAHLQLQNLLYERRHLEREIEKCNRFASIYQDVPVHSLDEFRVLAPAELTTDESLANDHQSMLNRLGFELAERLRLEEQRKSLALDKDAKMKDYREQERLVSEWFAQGTGIELAITDLKKAGNKVASRLGIPEPVSKEGSPDVSVAPVVLESMHIDKDSNMMQ